MVIIGDLHGGYPEILYRIKKFQLERTSFIQVGDWGLGFQQQALDVKALSQIDKFLGEKENRLYILRGNHDHKWFWDHRDTFHLQNVKLVKDYEVLEIEKREVFFIGGGISIDRLSRTPGKDYWADEEIHFDETLLKSVTAQDIDIVISHVAPKEAWPYTFDPIVLHFIGKEIAAGKDLAGDLENERQLMSRIYSHLKAAGCKEWYYGHYHESHVEEHNGVIFRCVAIQEMYDVK
ncbi:metallophosphoesterase [Chitinophaga arvensicola]|uniref:Calcineurin-like phosphoesterase n=1 Tax=Chitinophaga arvensicola TaxID=29529 RepID=A0A1I0SDN2_9BACT|nr:metallophosphoesterase [Chitinophaga arvensicola]SEW56402.1 Calcineurin-like phosphoesterase [Chitinophaga arvensicola]